MYKVFLSNNKSFQCVDDMTLLGSAAASGVILEHSCRTGRCGACRAKVIRGETEVIQDEESLSVEDLSGGCILTCCRSARTDVWLDIEDLGELAGIQVKIIPCRLDSLERRTDDVVEVVLRMPPTNRVEYLAGQYVDIIGKGGLRRSYSIANAPRDDGKITLHISKVEQGEMSEYWFGEAAINDLLRMEGPLGTFCLRKSQASELILLATGTGIAPIKAMLEQIEREQGIFSFKCIHLYWGVRTEEDIYWQPRFDFLPLKFFPVLSRSSEWSARKGYVQDAVIDDELKLKDAVVYACGSEVMINDAYEKLVSAGLDSKQFYSDAFVSSK